MFDKAQLDTQITQALKDIGCQESDGKYLSPFMKSKELMNAVANTLLLAD